MPSTKFFRSKFGDLPTFGMWADRRESDIVWGSLEAIYEASEELVRRLEGLIP